MSVMFSEELDQLRVKLADAQRQASEAERNEQRLHDQIRDQKQRAETAEKLAADRERELQQQNTRLDQLKVLNARMPALEQAASEAKSTLAAIEADRDKLAKKLAAETEKRQALEDTVTNQQAELTDLRGELEPTRTLLAALAQMVSAQQTIDDQLAHLNVERT